MKNTATYPDTNGAEIALTNIAHAAASAYNPATRDATKRTLSALQMISYLNHQEIKDEEIARQLCNIHLAPAQRAMAIEARAHELLRRMR